MQPKTAAKFWKESFFVFNFLVNKLTISFLIGRKPTVKSTSFPGSSLFLPRELLSRGRKREDPGNEVAVTSSSCRFYNLDFILNEKNARFLRSPTRNTPVSIDYVHMT